MRHGIAAHSTTVKVVVAIVAIPLTPLLIIITVTAISTPIN